MNSKIAQVWYTFCPVCCVSHVAFDRKLFRDEFAKDGINVSYIATLPVEDWQSHFSHKHPRLFRDGGNIPPIWTRSEGVDIKVIGMTWSTDGHMILVRRDSPIESVEELKGKRLVLPRRLPNLIDFRRAMAKRNIIMSLQAHGLTRDDIQFVDLPIDVPDIAKGKEATAPLSDSWRISSQTGWKMLQQPEVECLLHGEAEAMSAHGADAGVLEQLGVVKILFNSNKLEDWRCRVNIQYPHICTVSGSLAREHPELVTRWMKILVRAGIWAGENYTEVVRITAKATGRPEEVVRKFYADDFHKHLVPEISVKGIEALEIEKKFLLEHGFINNDFDVKSWVDPSFLNAALNDLGTEAR